MAKEVIAVTELINIHMKDREVATIKEFLLFSLFLFLDLIPVSKVSVLGLLFVFLVSLT